MIWFFKERKEKWINRRKYRALNDQRLSFKHLPLSHVNSFVPLVIKWCSKSTYRELNIAININYINFDIKFAIPDPGIEDGDFSI